MMKGSPSGWGFMEIMEHFVEASQDVETLKVVSQFNMTSNGYLEYIMRRSAKEIFDISIEP